MIGLGVAPSIGDSGLGCKTIADERHWETERDERRKVMAKR